MRLRANAQPQLNRLLYCRTCQSLDSALRRRISPWGLYRQALRAYLTMNLSTSWDPGILWNTVWEPLMKLKAKGNKFSSCRKTGPSPGPWGSGQ